MSLGSSSSSELAVAGMMSRDQLQGWVLAVKSPSGGNLICTVERKGRCGQTKAVLRRITVGTLTGLRIDINYYNNNSICTAEIAVLSTVRAHMRSLSVDCRGILGQDCLSRHSASTSSKKCGGVACIHIRSAPISSRPLSKLPPPSQ